MIDDEVSQSAKRVPYSGINANSAPVHMAGRLEADLLPFVIINSFQNI